MTLGKVSVLKLWGGGENDETLFLFEKKQKLTSKGDNFHNLTLL